MYSLLQKILKVILRKVIINVQNCDAVLWQSTYDKTKKSSLIRFIKTKNIHFDSVIVDEAHKDRNGESIIGNATRTLFNYAKKIMLLSGSSNSGYSSSFHSLLLGLIPNKLKANEVMEMEKIYKNLWNTNGSF